MLVQTIPFCSAHLNVFLGHLGGYKTVRKISAPPLMLAADKLFRSNMRAFPS